MFSASKDSGDANEQKDEPTVAAKRRVRRFLIGHLFSRRWLNGGVRPTKPRRIRTLQAKMLNVLSLLTETGFASTVEPPSVAHAGVWRRTSDLGSLAVSEMVRFCALNVKDRADSLVIVLRFHQSATTMAGNSLDNT